MNVVLVMFRENGERRSFSLSRDVTIVGRREDADFRIPLSDISRKHCRLIKDGNTLIVEDLGSSNGTFHNGRRIQETEINAGDHLQIGPVQFIVQINGVPSDDDIEEQGTAAGALQDTHLGLADSGARMPAPPPALPPSLCQNAPSADDDLEIIDDPASLDEVEEVDALEEIVDDASEDDDIIDLDEHEQTNR